jgi:hypothetical protein
MKVYRMNLYECKTIIITTERCYIKRKKWVDIIEGLFKNSEIFINEDFRDLTDEKKELYMNMTYFHRMPSLRREAILGLCCLTMGHLKVFDKIIENKLDNVLVLEDDSFVLPEYIDNLVLDINKNDYYINLSPMIWIDKKGNEKVANSNAIFYPSWEKVKEIREKIRENPSKLKQIDYMLMNINKWWNFNYSYKRVLGQPNAFESSYGNEDNKRNQLKMGILDSYKKAKDFYKID